MANFTSQLKQLLDNGETLNSALKILRRKGASPVESISAIHSVKKVNLAEAKRLFMDADAWNDRKKDFENFHDQLVDTLED